MLAEHILEVRHEASGAFLDARGRIGDYIRQKKFGVVTIALDTIGDLTALLVLIASPALSHFPAALPAVMADIMAM